MALIEAATVGERWSNTLANLGNGVLSMAIHPTAIVDQRVRIAESAEIGPYCIVGAQVEIGARTRLLAHIYLEGPTAIGEDNIFYPYSTIGVPSQDLKYRGERSETRIGARNRIREFVTIHRGTAGGGLVTSIGDDNLVMVYSHVAHDVRIGNHVILGNSVGIAGHVVIEDWADISPNTGVHQFCRIGRHAFIGPYSVVKQDVLPYSLTSHKPDLGVFGANSIGLERRGFSKAAIESLQTAFRLLTRTRLNTSQAIERIRAEVPASTEVDELIEFIRGSDRGFIK
jgi:UDP-N-acetylglucosamine acyltransferase